MNKLITALLFFFVAHLYSQAQEKPEFLKYLNDPWVQSKLKSMSLDEKIGQLFIVEASSERAEKFTKKILEDIENYKIGGIIYMEGHPVQQAKMTNTFQSASSIPLLIAMDAECGLAFRLDSTMRYPSQMALGAFTDDSLIYQMGKEIGQQCRRLGVHINFAPVADINSNPKNPVISYRSFGEDKDKVAQKSWMYASGMQDAGLLACAKHFPGHGDTSDDSHLMMPVITHSEEYLDSIPVSPFKYLIGNGIAFVMMAHLQVKALEPSSKIPASVSSKIIQKKLIGKLGFEGLIITDAMNMEGVTDLFPSGQAAVKALKAGNDMLEMVPRLGQSIEAVKKAVQEGVISKADIDKKCRKVLAAKKWLGLDQLKQVKTEHLFADLNKRIFQVTQRKLYEKALTVLINKDSILPLQRLDTLKIATLSIGTDSIAPFQQMLENYLEMDHFSIAKNADDATATKILTQLKSYNLVIASIHGMKQSQAKNFMLTPNMQDFIGKLDYSKTMVCLFGNPYALELFPGIHQAKSLIIAYQENQVTQDLAAQMIFGAVSASGRLPVTVNGHFSMNQGVDILQNGRLAYSFPENVEISSDLLEHKIDSLALLGLNEKAYPGCQVLIAKDGEVIFHKCYGFRTYDDSIPVIKENLYDFASVTKVTGPLPALMKLHSEGKIDLDKPFSFYYDDFKGTNKQDITFRDLLAHQGQIKAWIPFYKNALRKDGHLNPTVFRNSPSENFPLRISSNLYLNADYPKTVYDEIKNSALLPKKEYVYTDIPSMIFPVVISKLSGMDYEDYLKTNFYNPLGAGTLTYNPYRYFPIGQIIPTELDTYFRDELMQGYVHDESAAMLGGVSGNAGLFGCANDLAKIAQMYLQYGWYGGKQYIAESTIKEFIRRQFPENKNRRGLGFDKPLIGNHLNKLKDAYPAMNASENSFGHTGFTGTFFWVDPDNRLLFILLSNRVYPTRNNNKLSDLNIRPAMHQAIYDCIKIGLKDY